jgi:hypothetical protein
MAFSIALFKRVCCSGAISSMAPSSIKEEVVLIERVVVLAFTVDITFIKQKSNPPPPTEIKWPASNSTFDTHPS